MEKDIQNPHDAFFKRSFSFPKLRRDFCRCFLPEELLEKLNLDELEIRSGSFVDENLRERHTDLLLRTFLKDGEEAWVYLLFEHQSTPKPDMPFRLLRYLVRIWEQHREEYREEHPQEHSLPLIVPLVLYHGTKPWPLSHFFSDALNFRGDAGIRLTEMEYLVVDLSETPDHEIMEKIKGKIGEGLELYAHLLLFKHNCDTDFPRFLESLIPLLDELSERTTGLQCIETLARYIYHTRKPEERHQVEKLFRRAKPAVKEVAMTTIAQSIREEGRREGRQEGRQEGQLETARRIFLDLLVQRFGSLSEPLKERLLKIEDHETLLALIRQHTTCGSLEELEDLLDRHLSRDGHPH